MHTNTSVIAWIKDAKLFLKDHSDPIFSDAETCTYFRKKTKKIERPEKLMVERGSCKTPRIQKTDDFGVPCQSQITDLCRSDETHSNLTARDMQQTPPVAISAPIPVQKEQFAQPVSIPKSVKKLELGGSSFLRALFLKISPATVILPEAPSDAIAKKIATRWKTKNQISPITMIYYQENPEQREFLQQITKALDVYFGPATFLFAETIEQEKEWKTFLSATDLKLVIICDYTLWQLQNLREFYREIPTQKSQQLGDKQLFMLPDLSLYSKDPLLKRSLWKALCQTISSLQSPSIKN